MPPIGVSAGPAAERFTEISRQKTAEGAVVLDNAVACLDCSIERELRAGDHLIVLLRIHTLGAEPELGRLVLHSSRFRSLAPAP